jgi:hypothetical protein
MKREFNRESLIGWIKEAVIGPAGEKYFDVETGEVLDETGGGNREIYEVDGECYLAFDDTDDGPLIFPEGVEKVTHDEPDYDAINGFISAGKFHLSKAIESFSELPEMSGLVSELKDILEAVDNINQPSDEDEEDEGKIDYGFTSEYISCLDSCGYPHICIPFREEYIDDIEYEILLYLNCPAVVSLRDWLNQENNA